MYNVMSKKAEEFIDHEEIEECLAYAEDNKNNEACIDAILEKAKQMKESAKNEASEDKEESSESKEENNENKEEENENNESDRNECDKKEE